MVYLFIICLFVDYYWKIMHDFLFLYFFLVRPLEVRLLGENQPLSAGSEYEVACQTSGSRPPARLTWWRSGQRLDNARETVSDKINSI